jgi:hypothetical protein
MRPVSLKIGWVDHKTEKRRRKVVHLCTSKSSIVLNCDSSDFCDSTDDSYPGDHMNSMMTIHIKDIGQNGGHGYIPKYHLQLSFLCMLPPKRYLDVSSPEKFQRATFGLTELMG